MTELPDSDLISNIQTKNCNDSLRTLITRHAPLCFKVYHRFKYIHNLINQYEMETEKDLIIYKSALNFNPAKKCKFSTWLTNQTRYHFLHLTGKKRIQTVDLEEPPEKPVEFKFSDDTMDYVLKILDGLEDKRIKEVYRLRYYDSLSWTEIGRRINLTQQGTINMHNRVLELLRKKLGNEHL